MPKQTRNKSKTPKGTAKNANLAGDKLTAKTAKATAHKAPERRNENKVRGR
jgi:hypothetical protein